MEVQRQSFATERHICRWYWYISWGLMPSKGMWSNGRKRCMNDVCGLFGWNPWYFEPLEAGAFLALVSAFC